MRVKKNRKISVLKNCERKGVNDREESSKRTNNEIKVRNGGRGFAKEKK